MARGGSRATALVVLVSSSVSIATACVEIDDRDTDVADAGEDGQTGGNGGRGGQGGGGTGAVTCGAVVEPSPSRVQTCVYDLSCNPLVPPVVLSDCINYGLFTSCSEGAQSCDDVITCTGIAREDHDTVCGAGELGWKCDGDIAIRCNESSSFSIDCARYGASCDPFDSGEDLNIRPCALRTPSPCDTPSDQSLCAGNVRYQCVDGKAYGADCGVFANVCSEAIPGAAVCTEFRAECDGPFGVVSCSGDAIEVCDTSMGYARYDCAPAGATCATQGTSNGYCLAPGCTIAEFEACKESCLPDGRMQVCVGGAPYVIDCQDYGFNRCTTYVNHPKTGGDYVECI